MKRYGVFDTKDRVWLGSDAGPRLFSEGEVVNGHVIDADEAYLLARAAAQIADVQLRQAPGRTRAEEYTGDATVLKDEVAPAMTAAEALRRIERGAL